MAILDFFTVSYKNRNWRENKIEHGPLYPLKSSVSTCTSGCVLEGSQSQSTDLN